MRMDRDIRGAAIVGQLSELSDWEADLITHLRLWMDDADSKAQVWTSYANALGPTLARQRLGSFEQLLGVIEGNMLRPLVRHTTACRALGSDEAVFLNLVRLASEGDLHEAVLIATLIVRAPLAEQVAILAAEVGTTLRILRGATPALAGEMDPYATRH